MKIDKIFDQTFLIECPVFLDSRGDLKKMFSSEWVKYPDMKEAFFSSSNYGVLRGMHSQDNTYKIISIVKGKSIHVICDLRKQSESYKDIYSVTFHDKKNMALYLPPGVMHGFMALGSDPTIINYLMSEPYNPKKEKGIKWNSISFTWPFEPLIISDRDNGLPTLKDFVA